MRQLYKKIKSVGVLCALLAALFAIQVEVIAQSPKNIFVLISDGWGYNQIDATNYFNGMDSVSFQKFPVHVPMSTYPASTDNIEDNIDLNDMGTGYNSAKAWSEVDFINHGYTGSAPAATTMASGIKSAKYAIGVDLDSTELELITERAIALGKAAGVVSSVQLSHATPASFAVHNLNRNNYAEIARSFVLESKLNVVMGCGHPWYNADADSVDMSQHNYSYVGDSATWYELMADSTTFSIPSIKGYTEVQDIDGDLTPDAWTLITDSLDFIDLATTANPPKRVFGVPKSISTLQYDRTAGKMNGMVFDEMNEGVPTLVDMTLAAINVLQQDNDGLFLMVEGGAIDWAGHGNDIERIIEEQTDFNNMVDSIISWVEKNGGWDNNLVIVTGDHETGYLTGPDYPEDNSVYTDDSIINTFPVKDMGAGVIPDHKFNSGGHTNQLIPLYARGAGSEMLHQHADDYDFVRGYYIDNSNMAHVMKTLWPAPTYTEPTLKNVFLFISDGWGYNTVDATKYYTGMDAPYANWNQLAMSHYPGTVNKTAYHGVDSHMDINGWYNSKNTWSDWRNMFRDTGIENYTDFPFGDGGGEGATGSAAAATAMFTGYKTAVKATGVDLFGNPLINIGDRAHELGKSYGVVSSVQFAHATPACMVSHNPNRSAYPDIATEILLDSKASVVMGAGHPYYNNDAEFTGSEWDGYVGGKGNWNNLLSGATTFDSTSVSGNNMVQDIDADGMEDSWVLVQDSVDFVKMNQGTTPMRLLGTPKVNSTLQNNRSGSEFSTGVPTLTDMTGAAINVLDNNTNGFLMMVEGGAIDWAGHANTLDRMIQEQIDFDHAVQKAIDWVNANSNWDESLIIVTGDHETGYLVGENFDTNDVVGTYPVVDNGVGNLPGGKFMSGDHTNQLIPFYMKGAGEEVFEMYADHYDYVRGKYLNNTEIAQAIKGIWKDKSGDVMAIDTNQVNPGPKVEMAVADSMAELDKAYTYKVDDATFSDSDELTFSASLSNGDDLPSWLDFDPATATFSGTPVPGEIGPFEVMVTAKDTSHSPVSSIFTIDVDKIYHAPLGAPKNIFVLISDGWGYNHIDATNYFNGKSNVSFQEFPVHVAMSTYPASTDNIEDNIDLVDMGTGYNSAKAWSNVDFIKQGYTGSAPAATTMASGVKSAKYAIGVDLDSTDLELITEKAIDLGKSAGVVSSVQFTHATPASFAVHNLSRNNYDDIARSYILDSKLKVVMGCGHPWYNADADSIPMNEHNYFYVGDSATWYELMADSVEFSIPSNSGRTTVQDIDYDLNLDPWTLITDSMDFVHLAHGNTPKRVMGVPKSMSTLQYDRTAGKMNGHVFDTMNMGVPTLVDMTMAAINVLDDEPNGLFLMVEGGAIDWAGHGNDIERIIEEQTDFNNMVDSIVSWVENNGGWDNNLVIVTGDHETGYLTGPDYPEDNEVYESDTIIKTFPVADNGAGNIPLHKFNSGGHTNQLIPLYAKGIGSDRFNDYADDYDFVRGYYIDNSNIAHVMNDVWPRENEMKPTPKNVFLFISDGWGYNTVDATNYYTGQEAPYANWTEYAMSHYPGTVYKNAYSGSMSHLDINGWYNSKNTWSDWRNMFRSPDVDKTNYPDGDGGGEGATGSAAAATAMYTGYKTAVKATGVDLFGNPLFNIGNRAYEIGKSYGVVSSVEFAHATPAAMVAHNANRSAYPDIANELIIDGTATVVMGAGHPHYDNDGQLSKSSSKYVGGVGTWNNLLSGATVYDSTTIHGNNTVQDIDGDGTNDAWVLVQDSATFVSMADGVTPVRMLGTPKVNETLQNNRSGSDFSSGIPTLKDLTAAAINVLDNNTNGFLVMVEGGAIDWAGHANTLDRMIQEQIDFDHAVQSAIDWVNTNSSWDESLIIVTGDHETGYLVGENFDTNDVVGTYPVVDNGVGNLPGGKFMSGDHTNQLIPFYVKGAGEEVIGTYADHYDYVRGRYLNNTEIAQAIFKMWDEMPAAKLAIDASQVNHGPVIDMAVSDSLAETEEDFTYAINGGTFSDTDDLTYMASLANGAPLPAWLSFDPATVTFTGTPATGDIDTLDVMVMATDVVGSPVAAIFNLKVADINHAPVAGSIDNQTAYVNQAFSFTIPANTFTDADANDALVYDAMLDDDSDLPTWLTFNSGDQSFAGTPDTTDAGTITIKVTATDNQETVFSTFTLEVLDTTNTTGIRSITDGAIKVFPNPSNGIFNVTTGTRSHATITITDITGKVRYTKRMENGTAEIDLANQPKGIYIIVVETPAERLTGRISIQ